LLLSGGILIHSNPGGDAVNFTKPSLIAGKAGADASGYGAGAAGGGAGDAGAGSPAMTGDGVGGDGAEGVIQITYYTTTPGAGLASSQQSVVDTFALGVTLCKIIIIVTIASLIFTILQRTGLIPKFGNEQGGGGM
jgi:hypothetical protein